MSTDDLNILSRLYSDGKLNRETYLLKRRTLINEMVTVEDVTPVASDVPPVAPSEEVKSEKSFNLAYVAIPIIIAVIVAIVLVMPSSTSPDIVRDDKDNPPKIHVALVREFNSYAMDGKIETSEMLLLVKAWQSASQSSKNELIGFIDSASLDRSFTEDLLPFDTLTEVRAHLLSLDSTLAKKLSKIVSPITPNESREVLFEQLIDEFDFASDEERLKLKDYTTLYLELWDGDFDKEYETSLLHELNETLFLESDRVFLNITEQSEQMALASTGNKRSAGAGENLGDGHEAQQSQIRPKSKVGDTFVDDNNLQARKVGAERSIDNTTVKSGSHKDEEKDSKITPTLETASNDNQDADFNDNKGKIITTAVSSSSEATNLSSEETLQNSDVKISLSSFDSSLLELTKIMDLAVFDSQDVLIEFYSNYRKARSLISESDREKLKIEGKDPVLAVIGTHPNFKSHNLHIVKWSSQLANENSEENLELNKWVKKVLRVMRNASKYNDKIHSVE